MRIIALITLEAWEKINIHKYVVSIPSKIVRMTQFLFNALFGDTTIIMKTSEKSFLFFVKLIIFFTLPTSNFGDGVLNTMSWTVLKLEFDFSFLLFTFIFVYDFVFVFVRCWEIFDYSTQIMFYHQKLLISAIANSLRNQNKVM